MCSILEEDRAILRRVAVTGDLQRRRRNLCRLLEELRIGAIVEAVVRVVQHRGDGIVVADISRLDRIALFIVDVRRRCGRIGDVSISIDAVDHDIEFLIRSTVNRLERRIAIDNVVARDRVRRDRHRVRLRVVQHVIAQDVAGTRERFFEHIWLITRIIRTSIAIEICSTVVFVVNFDVVYVTVDQRVPRREAMCSILEEDRAILRRVAFAVDLQRSWRDARLAIHERDVVVVQRIECTFRFIRERQQIVAYILRPPTSRRAIKCSFVIVFDFAKTLRQRFFRITIDQALAFIGAIRVVVLRLIECRAIDRRNIANSNLKVCWRNTGTVSNRHTIIFAKSLAIQGVVLQIKAICTVNSVEGNYRIVDILANILRDARLLVRQCIRINNGKIKFSIIIDVLELRCTKFVGRTIRCRIGCIQDIFSRKLVRLDRNPVLLSIVHLVIPKDF